MPAARDGPAGERIVSGIGERPPALDNQAESMGAAAAPLRR